MKKIKYISLLLFLAICASCINDESHESNLPISEIIIEASSIQEVYNIEKNDNLTISPVISQTNKNKDVTYTWEINQEVYSHDKQFIYSGDVLGSYKCRLILANEDGKTFFPFIVNVNSPYEEGITIVSKDSEGNSMLSFMLGNPDGTDSGIFKEGDCFSVNNTDIPFASNVSDIIQTNENLIIACRGKEEEATSTLYYLNDKTFVVENMVTVSEYPDFRPTRMAVPEMNSVGTAYPILSDDGKIYEFSTLEGVVTEARKLQSNYSQSYGYYQEITGYYYLIFWDKVVNGLCELYNGYGPYYCSNKYHLSRQECIDSTQYNYFYGREFVNMFVPRLTSAQASTESAQIVVLTKSGFINQKTILDIGFWQYNYETAQNVLIDNGGSTMSGIGTSRFTEGTPHVANRTYYSLLFGVENDIYRWNYTSSEWIINAKILTSVGSDKAIITSMEISADHTRTYIAYYEPDEEGLNGHVAVINTDTGELLAQYDNICYRPVKIMYKKK
ncbi:MAG: hypothetical protein IJY36_00100 [Coprobacter sp.]|nr:hypothetical protein [Coprobacter sp.]